MFRFVRPYLSIVLLFTLAVFPALPQAAPGRDHIVSAADLHRAVRATGEARQADLTKIERFLSTETARQALKKADLKKGVMLNLVSGEATRFEILKEGSD